MQQTPDEILIQMVLQGRQQAYAALVDKYSGYVFTLAMRYVNDRSVAEELAQDVFVKAYRCLADFKGTSKFSTWLYTIVNTTCISYLRKVKAPAISLDHDQVLLLAENIQSDETADKVLDRKMQELTLSKAIGSLQPHEAQVITLFYQAEQSVEEIGQILGISANNAKVKLFRARQKLREVLETKFKNELT